MPYAFDEVAVAAAAPDLAVFPEKSQQTPVPTNGTIGDLYLSRSSTIFRSERFQRQAILRS